VMPVAFTFVSGAVFRGGGGDADTPVRYALTVANLDEGDAGSELLEAIRADGEIDLAVMEGPGADDEALRLVDKGDRSAALIIPSDYSAKLAAGSPVKLPFHRNPERMNPLVTRQAVERVLSRFNVSRLGGRAVVGAYEAIRGTPSESKRHELEEGVSAYVTRELRDPSLTMVAENLGRPGREEVPAMGFQRSSPAMALMFVLLNGLMMSSMLVTERRQRTLSRLLTAPVRRSEIVAANLAWRFAVGTMQLWFLIGLGALLFGVDWGDSFGALALVGAAYVMAVAGLSVLIGSLSRSSRRAETLSLVLALTMCALGGLWWPLEITPGAYQAAGHVVPTGWAMDAMHDLVSRGYTLQGVAPQILVLLGFALVFSVAAVAAFRYE
jgi:ABC-2 type transport system permease protein